jgi:hypothetical protein
MQHQEKQVPPKLNKVDRGFIFMMGPEIKKEGKSNFHYKVAKVISLLNKEIIFRLELIINSKEKNKC